MLNLPIVVLTAGHVDTHRHCRSENLFGGKMFQGPGD